MPHPAMLLLAKVASSLLQPLCWSGLLMLWALWTMPKRPVVARRALAAALLLGLFVGWQAPVDALQRTLLEDRHAVPTDELRSYVGVVVLGGALEHDYLQVGRPQVGLNDGAERMTMAVQLMRQTPSLQLLFTGGNPAQSPTGPTESDLAERFFRDQGVDPARTRYERASRTTDENARFTASLPGIDTRQRWLLLTSAWHMSRALAVFRAAGWNVTAYPVDFRTGASTPWTRYSIVRGAQSWNLLLHELVGQAFYGVRGVRRSASEPPAP